MLTSRSLDTLPFLTFVLRCFVAFEVAQTVALYCRTEKCREKKNWYKIQGVFPHLAPVLPNVPFFFTFFQDPIS